ncbi:methyl-accepting chemotaxis protein [Peribacillus glennii]|nr:methyl-accepting chemotaxis protein [Peribacillus glennii]
MHATGYEKLSSKILAYALIGLLLACAPLILVMAFIHTVTMKEALTLCAVVPFLAAGIYLVYRNTYRLSQGKYYISAASFVTCFILVFFVPTYEIWAAIILYLVVSLVYLDSIVVMLATGYALVVHTLHLVFNPYFNMTNTVDYIVSYIILTMIGIVCYCITIVGKEMLKEVTENEEKVKNVLVEVSKSVTVIDEFGKRLTANINDTNAISQEISAGYFEISRGVESQASAIAEINDKMLGSTDSVQAVTKNAGHMKELSTATVDLTKQGSEKLKNMQLAMNSVTHIQEETMNVMKELQENTANIGTIVAAIEEIANHTNLLSLNASIEAARAGEHGKSFAVVAGEIRKLSANAGSAAKSIGEILLKIGDKTQAVSEQLEKGKEAIGYSRRDVEDSGAMFTEITGNMASLMEKAGEIEDMLQQVEQNSLATSGEISNISSVTEESSAALEEMTAAMDSQRERIQAIAEHFEELEGKVGSLHELTDLRTSGSDEK